MVHVLLPFKLWFTIANVSDIALRASENLVAAMQAKANVAHEKL